MILNKEIRFDKIKGCLVGAAVGDALGMPTEYLSKTELNQFYNGRITDYQAPLSTHPCGHLKAGQYTDDTQQLLLLADSLVEKNGFDINDFGQRVGNWGWKCRSVPGYNRFAGGTSMSAALELYAGGNPLFTGKNRATCGSAMRVAPLGLFYSDEKPEVLKDIASVVSRVTHTHPAAVDSSVFISLLVANLYNGFDVESAVSRSLSYLDSDLKDKLDYVVRNQSKNPTDMGEVVGCSESCYETVPMALYCFLHSSTDFEKTVVEAANLVPGDTDSIACIAGALSGVYNGYHKIPLKFINTLENIDYFNVLSLKFVDRKRKTL